jgi:hypothetical protein
VSTGCTLFGNCECASCQARKAVTPLSEINRPGLDALQYRVGTFGSFREAMLDYITLQPVANPNPSDPSQSFRLTSRSSDDYGIAMLELWAYVCDVLTFYQQAIANEAYLRTATQRASLARLAGLLGYRPAPAVSASAYLAFLTNRNASSTVPAGAQEQSVPPPGKKPVVFETGSSLAATAADNQPMVLGPQIPLTLNDSGLLIIDDPTRSVTKGDTLLFFNTSRNFVSQQPVTAVMPQPKGSLVSWRGSLNGTAPDSLQVYRLGRTFRVFGANAPATWAVLTVSNNQPVWNIATTSFELTNGVDTTHPVWLDGVYTGLAAGAPLAIQYSDGSGSHVIATSILSVAAGTATTTSSVSSGSTSSPITGPMTGNSTALTIAGATIPTNVDLTTVTIYELMGAPLTLSSVSFDQSSAGIYPAGAQSINVLDASGIGQGTRLLLVSSNPATGIFGDVVRANDAPTPITSGGVTLGYSVPFSPALANSYVAANTTLYANVVSATEGKTQRPETLGSGDASQAWQEFALQAKPVTYVPSAAPGPGGTPGAATTLRVFVNSVEWKEVRTFYGRDPTDAVFVTRIGDDGTFYVRFGDGVTGQRLPTGSKNVTAMYRAGAGSDGNVDGGAISQMLQTVTGVKSVTNPLTAFGGKDAEAPDQIRQNAPASVLTLGRAVSLRDYEALALTYPGITKARASWTDLNDRRGVALAAAAAADQPLGQLTQPLLDYLNQYRDPNVPLSITSVTPVNFVFRAKIHVQSGNLLSAMKPAVDTALGVTGDTGLLSYAQLEIGESIFESKLLAVLQDVPGVEWVELVELSGPSYMSDFDVIYIDPTQIGWPSLTGNAGDTSVDLQYVGGVNDLQ